MFKDFMIFVPAYSPGQKNPVGGGGGGGQILILTKKFY